MRKRLSLAWGFWTILLVGDNVHTTVSVDTITNDTLRCKNSNVVVFPVADVTLGDGLYGPLKKRGVKIRLDYRNGTHTFVMVPETVYTGSYPMYVFHPFVLARTQ